jgi:hypothetical protein
MNAKNREYATWQMNTQRQWSLDDWHRQNAYNTPAAQMDRFRAAGLNPNLIYGQSSEAPAVRSSPSPQQEGKALFQDLPGQTLQAIGAYQDYRMKDLEAVSIQKNQAIQDATLQGIALTNSLKGLNVTRQGIENSLAAQRLSSGAIRYEIDKQLMDTTIAQGKQRLANLQAQGMYTIDENRRREALTENNLALGLTRIAQMEGDMALNPYRKAQINAAIANLNAQTKFTENEKSKNALWDVEIKKVMHENKLWDAIINKTRMTGMELDNHLKAIRTQLEGAQVPAKTIQAYVDVIRSIITPIKKQ